MNRQRVVAWLVLVAIAIFFAFYVAGRPMDFRVYYYGARGVFDGTRPVYGRASGLGWPMHYRYPPLFLLLFTPFAWLPLGLSAALWVLLKVVVLTLLLRAMQRRWPSRAWPVAALLAAPYVIQDFRYGNAQFFIFALTVAALLLVDENPVLAAGSLALAIAVKVWPLFFVPYLLVRRYIKVAAWTLVLTLGLTLLPAFYFGLRGNLELIRQWVHQEYLTQSGEEEIWFPSQSLRGVLMRYLTPIDYSQLPDSHYNNINLANVSPRKIRTIWFALAGIVYAVFLWQAHSQGSHNTAVIEAIGFCLIALLEPFTQKYALVILLFPAFIVAREMKTTAVRAAVYLAIVIALLQPLIPGSAAQREMQVLGFDFAATVMVAVGLSSLLVGGSVS